MRKFFNSLREHLGVWLSAFGVALMSLDVSKYAEAAKEWAAQYHPKWSSWVALIGFVLLLARTLYVGYVMRAAGTSVTDLAKNPPP